MYRLLIKRYRVGSVLLLIASLSAFLMVGVKKNETKDYVTQTEYETYLETIQQQSEDIQDVAIFGGMHSYDVEKIEKTAQIYQRLQNVQIAEASNVGAELLLTDEPFFVFVLIAILYELYVLVYDKEKGYDALIQTLYLGNREYVRKKIYFLITVVLIVFLSSSLFRGIYMVGKYSLAKNVSIQSVEGFMCSWLHLDLYAFSGLLILWRSLWIVMILTGIAILYHLIHRIWKALTVSMILVLSAVLVHMNREWRSIGILFQMSSGYFKSLHLFPLFSEPVNTSVISAVAAMGISVASWSILWKYGDRLTRKIRNTSAKKRARKKRRVQSNFICEGRKVLVLNGYITLMVLGLVFQWLHYGMKVVSVTESDVYYRQYMQYLDGAYSEEKEEYMIAEGKRYERIQSRLQELREKAKKTPSEQVEINQLQNEARGEFGYRMALERMEHVKQQEGAILFDDFFLQKVFKEGKTDTILDVFITLFFSALFGVLLFMEEKISNTQEFLETLPLKEKMKKSKKHYILLVSFYWTIMCCLPKMVFYGQPFPYSRWMAASCSVTYLPQIRVPIWSIVMIVMLGCFLINYGVTYLMWRILEKEKIVSML